MNYSNIFREKKILIMGLGLLGRGIGDAQFLAECGADVLVTDLKTKKELEPSLKQLKKFKNIKYVLGRHRKSDFKNKDFILKAAGVPLDSLYIKEARRNKIPIKMDASWFVELVKEIYGGDYITGIGITGTKGKSMTTQLIYNILKTAKKQVHIGGNVRGVATLPLLKKIKKGDFVVLELDSWQLQGFGDANLPDGKAGISPNIAVFTNFMPDHLNYYKGNMALYFNDKANIFKYQKRGDVLVCGDKITGKIKTKGKKIIATKNTVPKNWKILKGGYYKENIAMAIEVSGILGIKRSITKMVIEDFKGISGRLELVRKINGVEYYNDTTATIPFAVEAALKSFPARKSILIAGGADKKLNYKELAQTIKKRVKTLILFKGSATQKLKKELGGTIAFPVYEVKNIKDAVACAYAYAEYGEIVLLSPGAASFGLFQNEYERGDQFVKEVKNLK